MELFIFGLLMGQNIFLLLQPLLRKTLLLPASWKPSKVTARRDSKTCTSIVPSQNINSSDTFTFRVFNQASGDVGLYCMIYFMTTKQQHDTKDCRQFAFRTLRARTKCIESKGMDCDLHILWRYNRRLQYVYRRTEMRNNLMGRHCFFLSASSCEGGTRWRA